jgi:hypothetical protein
MDLRLTFVHDASEDEWKAVADVPGAELIERKPKRKRFNFVSHIVDFGVVLIVVVTMMMMMCSGLFGRRLSLDNRSIVPTTIHVCRNLDCNWRWRSSAMLC